MALIRWQPWQEMEIMRRQLDQLFDELAPVNRATAPVARERKAWNPAIELKQTETELVLRAELPGIAAKDLDVQVSREAVAIAGEYRSEINTEANKVFRSEFRYGNFHRVIPLPVEVQNDKVNAEFKDGILTLTLPKVVDDRHQVVKLNLTGDAPAAAVEASAAPALEAPTASQAETGDVWTETAQ